MARLFLFAFFCILGAGLVLGQEECVFTELNQGLDPKSWDAGANYSAHLPNISDEQECREVCCAREDCQLALIETPADGSPQCSLVNCMKDGKDVCVLEARGHSKAYRKIQVSDRANSSTGKNNNNNMASVKNVALFQWYYFPTEKTVLLPEPHITTLNLQYATLSGEGESAFLKL